MLHRNVHVSPAPGFFSCGPIVGCMNGMTHLHASSRPSWSSKSNWHAYASSCIEQTCGARLFHFETPVPVKSYLIGYQDAFTPQQRPRLQTPRWFPKLTSVWEGTEMASGDRSPSPFRLWLRLMGLIRLLLFGALLIGAFSAWNSWLALFALALFVQTACSWFKKSSNIGCSLLLVESFA